MTPEDLAKFNPGKVLLTVECESVHEYRDGDTHGVFLFDGGARYQIPASAIVSIERVRPELTEGWTWKWYPNSDAPDRAVYTDGRGVEVMQVWVEDGDGDSDISVAVTDLALASIPFAVIEAVRNA